jgi:hypothetical protein
MRKFESMLCGLVVAFAGCMSAPPADHATAADESVQVQTITRSVSGAAETCTITEGACHVGQCELGPNDTVQRITEVCCTAPGVCTTENYRLCGC